MIKANELRIGNWIELKNSGFIKVEIDNIGDVVNNPAIFNPIPLTPEILESCGFVNGYKELSEFTTLIRTKENKVGLYYETWFAWVEVEYLHDLQNLYFSHTKKELNVNLHVESAI